MTRTLVGAADYTSSSLWPWVFFDGADFDLQSFEQGVHEVRFKGVVWQGHSGQTIWRIVHSDSVSVRINGRIVYQETRDDVPVAAHEIPVSWQGNWLELEVEYPYEARSRVGSNRAEMGIYERVPLGGWRLLPTWRLYAQAPDPSLVARERTWFILSRLAWVGLFSGIAAWLVAWAWRVRLWQRREAWVVAAIVALSLILRLGMLLDQAAHGPYFYYLAPGSDNYVLAARNIIAGQYQLAGTYWQPGMIVWLAILTSAFGPHLWTQYVITAVVGAISTGAVTVAGWMISGQRGGMISGLIAALYAPLIGYQTTLGVDGLAATLTAWVALVGLWAIRQPSPHRAALFGLMTGLAAPVRPTLLVFGPAFFLALLAARDSSTAWRGWQRVLSLTAVAAIFTLLVLSPQTIANWSVGQRFLISGNGPVNFYIGNNRDASGLIEFDRPAYLLTKYQGGQWQQAAIHDIQADPVRFAALLLRKIGLFWDNNDYLAGSPSPLAVLSLGGWLGMTVLAWLGWTGLGLLFAQPGQRRSPMGWLLVWMISLLTLGTAFFMLDPRLRLPIVPLVCIPAGLTVDRLFSAIRARHPDRALLRAGAVALVLLLVLSLFERFLPPKRFFGGNLPAGAVTIGSNFGGSLELVGFGPVETSHHPGGYFYLTLYWQALVPVDRDYKVSVQLVDPAGNPVAWQDISIGSVSYPQVGTSAWPVGKKLAEGYLIDLPAHAPPVMDIYIDVYDPNTGARLPLTAPDGTPTGEDRVRLGRLGLITDQGIPTLEGPVADVDYRLDNALHVTGFSLPQEVSPSGDLSVGVRLETAQPIYEDYVLFFHLFDDTGKLVAQSDSPTLSGDWTTAALIPGQPLGAIRVIDLPDDLPPGSYRLVMGMYSYPSLARLPVQDAAGNTLPDGLIEVGWLRIGD